jgi:hypothetical protein
MTPRSSLKAPWYHWGLKSLRSSSLDGHNGYRDDAFDSVRNKPGRHVESRHARTVYPVVCVFETDVIRIEFPKLEEKMHVPLSSPGNTGDGDD